MPRPNLPPAAVKTALHALPVLAFNTLLALGLTLAGEHDLPTNLVFSHCIGLAMWGLIEPAARYWVCDLRRDGWRLLLIVPLGGALGYIAGNTLAQWWLGMPLDQPDFGHARYLFLSLAAGALGTYFFVTRELLRQARERNAAQQLHLAEARLKLLQAQLEPHMLFNTLANLRVLVDIDPVRATEMLDRLVAFLRATLGASRQTMHPLSAEFARLQDYLALMAVRMGPRLHYTLDLPPALADQPVPTLLLQPLVENAIRHGLEPQVAGGSIHVSAQRAGKRVLLLVQDNGVGLRAADGPVPAGGGGFGLQQAHDQLAAAFGPTSAIELIAASEGGTIASAAFFI